MPRLAPSLPRFSPDSTVPPRAVLRHPGKSTVGPENRGRDRPPSADRAPGRRHGDGSGHDNNCGHRSLTDNTARGKDPPKPTRCGRSGPTLRHAWVVTSRRTGDCTVDERRSDQKDSPTDADDDVLELERELCRLPEISAARVVTDDSGRPTEVHILADTTKHAKQVVRDVQSVALGQLRDRARPPDRLGRPARQQRQRQRSARGHRGGRARVPSRPRQQHRRGQRAPVARPGHPRRGRQRVGRLRRGLDRLDGPRPARRHCNRRRVATARARGRVHRRRQRPDRAGRRARRRDRHRGVRRSLRASSSCRARPSCASTPKRTRSCARSSTPPTAGCRRSSEPPVGGSPSRPA